MLIVNAHRLPSNHDTRPPIIIARFGVMYHKELILKKAHMLKGTGCAIKTDLPAVMKKKRSELESVAYRLRSDGNSTRLRVVAMKVILEYKARTDSSWKLYTV